MGFEMIELELLMIYIKIRNDSQKKWYLVIWNTTQLNLIQHIAIYETPFMHICN